MSLTPIYWLVAAALAIAYLLRVGDAPGATRTMLKALSVATLAVIAVMEGGPYLLLVLALLLCAAGDAFLAQGDDRALKNGMAAFAAGHLVYIVLFLNQGSGVGQDPLRLALQLLTLAGSAGLSFWLWPHLGAMRGPVSGYIVVVTLMALIAIGLPKTLAWVSVGAILFLISDAILAVELFRMKPQDPARRWTAPAVWTLYWGGQAAITAGLLYPLR